MIQVMESAAPCLRSADCPEVRIPGFGPPAAIFCPTSSITSAKRLAAPLIAAGAKVRKSVAAARNPAPWSWGVSALTASLYSWYAEQKSVAPPPAAAGTADFVADDVAADVAAAAGAAAAEAVEGAGGALVAADGDAEHPASAKMTKMTTDECLTDMGGRLLG